MYVMRDMMHEDILRLTSPTNIVSLLTEYIFHMLLLQYYVPYRRVFSP